VLVRFDHVASFMVNANHGIGVTVHNHIDDNEENTDNKLERQTRAVPNE